MATNIEKYLQQLPNTCGIYLMKDQSQQILYIGKAKSLKNRVSSYFRKSTSHPNKIKFMVTQIATIDFIQTQSEVEALLLESQMIRELQPKYNSRQKDDKTYPYLVISKEAFPKVMIAREHECLPPQSFEFYGPYVDVEGMKNAFQLLQRIFRFRTCDLNIPISSRMKVRPCLLAAIGYCTAPCASRITQEDYYRNIDLLKKFLSDVPERSAGTEGRRNFTSELRREMWQASEHLDFEKAAKLRDQIRGIESLDKHPVVQNFANGELLHLSPQNALKALQAILHLPHVPQIIEGIDISHHHGKEAVGSLVCFIDGIPHTPGYRRYKIHCNDTQNDYLMLREILERRFCGQDKNRQVPDLLLVDGGKGQLQSIVQELAKINISIPALVAVAKKEEEIYIPTLKTPLNIPKNSLVNHLLCHVRDEAHRFAQSYHCHLKDAKIHDKFKAARKNEKKGY